MSSRSLLSNDASQSTIAEPTLLAMLSGTTEEVSKACEALRRALSHTPVTIDVQAASASVLQVLERSPSQLRVAHLCVAVLAHPALNAALLSPPLLFDAAVLRALERLALSAAFVHTALAALQNSASAAVASSRDPVLVAVVAAMRQHPSHTGILLRAADLVAFHLNQPVSPPTAATFELCAVAIIAAAPRLAATAQGASAGLLALVACARHSVANASSHPRFTRTSHASSHSIVDPPFATMVVAAMNRHKEFAPVQVLSAELVRVAAAGSSNAAKTAAREFFSVNALNGLLIAIHVHQADDTVVERSVAAIRSLLLLGSSGSQARAAKPTIVLSPNVADSVIQVTEEASVAMAARNPDVAALAKVLASDVRIAASVASSSSLSASSAAAAAAAAASPTPGRSTRERSFSVVAFGKRFVRSLRLSRSPRFENGSPTASRYHGHRADKPYASGHVFGATRNSGGGGSGLAFANSAILARTDWLEKDSAKFARAAAGGATASSSLVSGRSAGASSEAFIPPNRTKSTAYDRYDAAVGDQVSGDLRQTATQSRWRSVGGRWRSRRPVANSLPTAAAAQQHYRHHTMQQQQSSPQRVETSPLPRHRPPAAVQSLKKKTRSPLALTGGEVANLSRQPSHPKVVPIC